MKIFVTGSTGFVGKHLIRALIKENHEVCALCRNSKNVHDLKKAGVRNIVIGDIIKSSSYKKCLTKCDALVHLAALRSNWMSEKEFNRINSEAIRTLLQSYPKIKHAVITSSVYVHGSKAKLPISENSPLRANEMYGRSKINAENITREVCGKLKIPFTIIRPAIIYGSGDNESGMIMKLISMIDNKKLPIIGNGNNTLHLIHVKDLVKGYLKVLKKGGKNETYILAGQETISLNKLIELVKRELKSKYDPPKIPRLPIYLLSYAAEFVFSVGFKTGINFFKNEPPLLPTKVETLSNFWKYDINKAKKSLGFSPSVKYSQGIKEVVTWYLSNNKKVLNS